MANIVQTDLATADVREIVRRLRQYDGTKMRVPELAAFRPSIEGLKLHHKRNEHFGDCFSFTV